MSKLLNSATLVSLQNGGVWNTELPVLFCCFCLFVVFLGGLWTMNTAEIHMTRLWFIPYQNALAIAHYFVLRSSPSNILLSCSHFTILYCTQHIMGHSIWIYKHIWVKDLCTSKLCCLGYWWLLLGSIF